MRKSTLLLSAVVVTGCANMEAIRAPESKLNALRGTTFTVLTYQKPDFAALTADKIAVGALFGVIGSAIAGTSMVSAGNEIIEQHAVSDPAPAIADKLSGLVSDKLAASSTRYVKEQDPVKESADDLSGMANKNGIILDVKTINWMFTYLPTNWARYKVVYTVRARLVDAASGTILSQAPCQYESDTEATAPTYDQLLDNDGALLKTKVAAGINVCSDLIAKNMFGA